MSSTHTPTPSIGKPQPPVVDFADTNHTWGTEIRGVGETASLADEARPVPAGGMAATPRPPPPTQTAAAAADADQSRQDAQ
ncbi:hypothetical protein FS837_008773 [Tulasnella sp. UAMH 9824]|nr:hypothetical protein FS837_008773 [Tulasnella sp. UAMH 9824]